MTEKKPRFAIVGYGRMGHLVEQVLKERGEEVALIVDPNVAGCFGIWPSLHELKARSVSVADVAICFTSPDAGFETTKAILASGTPVVVGTTKFYLRPDGALNEEMLQELLTIAKTTGAKLLYSPNFSAGMNAFWQALEAFAPVMAALGYDPAVEERHHTRKADLSGTAKAIGQILLKAYAGKKDKLLFGFPERRIDPVEITVASTRAGSIPGTHTVIFDSPVDTIEFTHTVRDPRIFAIGAVDCAHWLLKQPGWNYTMKDVLKSS